MNKTCSLANQTTKHETGLRIMPDDRAGHSFQCHILPVPVSCCPVSKNPQGGTIKIFYQPVGTVLEVYALAAYLKMYVGGFTGSDPERNQEGMIKKIAQDCSDALGIRVRVRADLILDVGQLIVSATGKPCL